MKSTGISGGINVRQGGGPGDLWGVLGAGELIGTFGLCRVGRRVRETFEVCRMAQIDLP